MVKHKTWEVPAEVLNAVPNGAAKDPELAAEDEEGANPGDGEEGVALGADAWVLVSLALAASFGGCAEEAVVAGAVGKNNNKAQNTR